MIVRREFIEAPDNRAEAAAILAKPEYIGVDAEVIRRTLDGRLKVSPDGKVRESSRYLLVGREGAARPDPVQDNPGKPDNWFTTNGDIFAVGTSKLEPFEPRSPDGSRSYPRTERSQGRRRVESLLRARRQRRDSPVGERRGSLRRPRRRSADRASSASRRKGRPSSSGTFASANCHERCDSRARTWRVARPRLAAMAIPREDSGCPMPRRSVGCDCRSPTSIARCASTRTCSGCASSIRTSVEASLAAAATIGRSCTWWSAPGRIRSRGAPSSACTTSPSCCPTARARTTCAPSLEHRHPRRRRRPSRQRGVLPHRTRTGSASRCTPTGRGRRGDASGAS